MQKKHYRIHFVSGELSGRSFLIPDEGLLIGKSYSAAIRPGSPDIRIEHARLHFQDDRLILESLAEEVFVREKQLPPGTECAIEPGMDVRLGKNLSFVLETDEGITQEERSADDEDTADDATADSLEQESDDEKREGVCTRYASAMELEDLQRFAERKIRRRKIQLTTCVMLFLAVVFGGFLYTEFYTENPVTWPGEVSGNYNEGEYRIELPPAGKFMIYFPKCKLTRINPGNDKNNCDVMTLLGKNLDVLFHIRLTVNTLPNGYIVSRKKSFENWKKTASEKFGFSFVTLPEQKFYSQETCGYPYYSAVYKRKEKDFQYQGMVSYLRYHDKEIIVLREVPLHHYWRTERVLERFNCFVVSPDAVLSYWEIPEEITLDKSKVKLYKVLLELMWGHLITCNWQDAISQFAELLSLSYHQKDASMARDALALWKEFRTRQQSWYAQICLAYQKCKLNQDMEGMIRIRNECIRKFHDDSDCRYNRVITDKWDIEP